MENTPQQIPQPPKSKGEKVGNTFLWLFFSGLIYWVGFMIVTGWREVAMENPGPGGSIGFTGYISGSDLLLIVAYFGWIFLAPVIAIVIFLVKFIKAMK